MPSVPTKNQDLPVDWLDELTEGVLLVKRSDLSILYANPAMAHLLDATVRELIGEDFRQFFGVDLLDEKKMPLLGSKDFQWTSPTGKRLIFHAKVKECGQDCFRIFLDYSEVSMENLLHQIQVGVMVVIAKSLVFCNHELSRLSGFDVKELLGKEYDFLIPPEDVARFEERLLIASPSHSFESRIKTKSGSTTPVEISMKAATMYGQESVCVTMQSIVKKKLAESQRESYQRQLQQSLEYNSNLFERLPLAAWVIDFLPLEVESESNNPHCQLSHRAVGFVVEVRRVNQAMENMLGLTKEEMVGRSIFDPIFVDEENAKIFEGQITERRQGKKGSYEVTLNAKGSHRVPVLLESIPILLDDESGMAMQSVGLMVDLTERKRWEAELKRLNQKLKDISSTDALTDLANRRTFDDYLLRQLDKAEEEHRELSLILIDIDFFKPYNDNYGHLEGDACLVKMAQIFKSVFRREADMVCRYGGEEFGVILPNTPREGAFELAEELRRKVDDYKIPHEFSLIAKNITISLGVASIRPGAHRSHKELIHAADQALYCSKQQGRNRTSLEREDGGCTPE